MSTTKSRYIPALDGLRAFAVLAVIAYHMHFAWAPGGLLGVTVFFVLSGYLITSLLLIEFQNTRKIDLPQFWLRRVRRLVPAIVFVVVCVAALCALFDHALLTKMRPDVVPSLLFFNNWWQIFHDVSYFDALGAPSPLAHFWSLAIEEQFYLIWPVALFIAHKVGMKRSTMRNSTIVLAALSALEMAILFDPAADPSRVYYGTDTRAFSLLIGAWLAFVWPSHMLGAQGSVRIPKQTRTILDGVGIAALIGLVLMVVFTNGFSPFLYRGGLVLCSVLTAVAIAVMVHPASILGRFAGAKPLVWIGKRSYGIYLWHYPLILLMSPGGIGGTPLWLSAVQLVVIFAVSMFSYRFVEDPIRHGAIGKLVKNIRSGALEFSDWIRTRFMVIVAASALLIISVGGLIIVPPTSALEGGDLLKQTEEEQTAQTQTIIDSFKQEEKPRLDILMIGDSVSVRTIPYFNETFPYGAIDAAVNRQLFSGQGVYDTYKAQNIVGDVVVLALGTNGVATDEQLDELLATVGADKKVWLVTTRSPQDWVGATNDALIRASERHSNVHIIDWFGISASRGGLFDGDGTHLTEEGARFYVDMIYQAVADYLPVHQEGDSAAVVLSPAEASVERASSAAQDTIDKLAQSFLNPIDTEAAKAA